MRIIERHPFALTTDRLLIFDPMYLYAVGGDPPRWDVPDDVLAIDTVVGDGAFAVYRSGDILVIDTAPRVFKARSRADFARLPNEVAVDTGSVCFAPCTDARLARLRERIDWGFVSCPLPPGDYAVWIEAKDTSRAFARSIICFGREQRFYLHGETASVIHELEKEAARVLRMKGSDRQRRLADLRRRILDLHWAGNKDRRLDLLAAALKIDLPPRWRARPPG